MVIIVNMLNQLMHALVEQKIDCKVDFFCANCSLVEEEFF